jgi:hypothetical protein
MPRRFAHLSLGILLLFAGARGPAAPWAGGGAFVPYVAPILPQRAAADFDADGHPDVAVIQDGRDGSRVVVTLSGSRDAIALSMDAVSVAANDIDHDGDADLVVATSSNRVVVWINDGRGHFMEEPPSPSQDLSPATAFSNALRDELLAVGPTVPQIVASGRRHETAVVAARVRPPTAPLAVGLSFLSLPSLRGPPLTTPPK